MKITKHIAFFYNKERLPYISQIVEAVNKYPFYTDIYIHSNEIFSTDFLKPTNGKVFLIAHDLTDKDPLILPQLTKDLMKVQRDAYDIFIYTEDDILIPHEAIEYWLEYKDQVLKSKCNLGFIRIEVDSIGEEFACDLHNEHCITQQLFKACNINGQNYVINDVNTYTAFWIYDKTEFNRFVNSQWWDPKNIKGYGLREAVAIGLQSIRDSEMNWYAHTIIPLMNFKLLDKCKVYHLPNNYIKEPYSFFSTVRFDEIYPLTQDQVLNPNFAIERKRERLLINYL